MKRFFQLLVCLSLLAVCLSASGQNLKPAKDKQTKKYGYQNKEKEWVIPPTYDDAKRFDDDGCALVKVDGRHGLIDMTGNYILQPEYDDIGKYDKNGLCKLTIKEGKQKFYGAANRAGDVLLPVRYHAVNLPKAGGYITASCESEDPDLQGSVLWAVYDLLGKEIFAPQFLESPTFNNGTCIARDGRTGLEGVASLDGETLLPFDYLAVSRSGNGYRALGKDFTQTSFNADLRPGEYFRHPGAVIPYDPMGDPIRAAAWHSGVIGTRLHANQVRSVELKPGGGSSRSVLCRSLGLDWGVDRFLRLEPCVLDAAEEDAMEDPASGKYYTLKALLYEADGTLVGEVADKGWLEAECQAGVLYNAGGLETWIVLNDPNALALSSYSLNLQGYRDLTHDNVYNGLGIRSEEVERLSNARRYADRCVNIVKGDNVGVTSYLPPSVDMQQARMMRDVSRSDLFHHAFHMGDVVNCNVAVKEGNVEVELYEQLALHFEDSFREPYYSMSGDEVIYWGPNNGRTIRVSLEPTYATDAMVDDIGGTRKNWSFVLSLYEEDGTWLRTLAKAPFPDYAQDGVLVFQKLGVALVAPNAAKRPYVSYGWSNYEYKDIRGKVVNYVKLPGAQPLPHALSALDAFKVRRY